MRKTWLFNKGQWEQINSLIEDVWDANPDLDFEDVLSKAGYERHGIVIPTTLTVDTFITVYHAATEDLPYQFLVQITFENLDVDEIYVPDLPNLLELFGKMAPMLQTLIMDAYVRRRLDKKNKKLK